MKKIILVSIAVANLCCLPRYSVAQSIDTNKEVTALKNELIELRALLPTQAHVMVDVDYHFSNLWFAAQKENWPLANFYLSETKGRLNWMLRLRPVRKLSTGQDVELTPLLKNMEQSSLTQLKSAIDHTNRKDFETAYRLALSECYACHITIEKSILRPQVPVSPATHIISMQPNAKQP